MSIPEITIKHLKTSLVVVLKVASFFNNCRAIRVCLKQRVNIRLFFDLY